MIKSKIIDSFFKRKTCDEDEKNASTSSKIEKLYENPNIEENEKQLSKVSKVTYNEFENTLERDPGEASSNLTISTKSNWWGTKGLSKMGSISNASRKLSVCLVKMIILEDFSTHGLSYFLHG